MHLFGEQNIVRVLRKLQVGGWRKEKLRLLRFFRIKRHGGQLEADFLESVV